MSTLTLDNLDPLAVAQYETFLATWLQEVIPTLDLTEGTVLRETLIRPAALFHVLRQTDLDRLRQSMSLLAIEADPTLADDTIVDGVLSNLRLTRSEGAKATGQITIIVENLLTTSVPVGTTFTNGSLVFVTPRSFVAVTSADAVLDSSIHRQLTLRRDGTYAFVVDVEAESAGEQYLIRRNTGFDPAEIEPSPPGILTAFATSDFTGGKATETNADLVARAKLALSPQVLSGRTHINAALATQTSQLKASSIIGFGDEEMLRDRHNIFAIAQGGKADVYTRTAAYPVTVAILKTAVVVDAPNKTLQVSLGRDDIPGFYQIIGVLPEGSTTVTVEKTECHITTATEQGTLELLSDVRALDLTATNVGDFVPDIASLVEGAYSRYQTGIIQFRDPAYDAANPVRYQVFAQAMPDIDKLQDYCVNRGNRNPQADYLVRAPIPAYTTISLDIRYTGDAPDAASIKQAVSDAVNGLNFALGQLPASLVYKAAHSVLPASGVMVASPVDMLTTILAPGSDPIVLRSGNVITLPEKPELGVTSRTTVFFTSPEDVDVALTKVNVLPV